MMEGDASICVECPNCRILVDVNWETYDVVINKSVAGVCTKCDREIIVVFTTRTKEVGQ